MNLNNILMKLETVKFILIFIFINFAFSQDIVFITESDDPSAAFGGTDYRTTIFFQDVVNDDLVNMDQMVSVSYNEKEIYKGHVKRNGNIIRESTIEHGDPQSVYFGEIEININ